MKDSAGQKLAYIYYEEEPGRRSAAKFARVSVRKIGTVSGKQPSNKIWPVIIAMAIVVIAIWIFTVLLHP